MASFTERSIVVKPGANLVVVDLEPGGMSMMHRTVSIDFSICVIGEIDHELDSGEKVRLLPGVRRDPETIYLGFADGSTGPYHSKRDHASMVEPVEGQTDSLCCVHDPVSTI